jgi:hypothetical protein
MLFNLFCKASMLESTETPYFIMLADNYVKNLTLPLPALQRNLHIAVTLDYVTDMNSFNTERLSVDRVHVSHTIECDCNMQIALERMEEQSQTPQIDGTINCML